MASRTDPRGLVLLFITSCFFIAGLLFDYMPMIVDDHIKRTIELATNQEILGFWTRPPIELQSYYWLYDIVNADQFQSAGERAQVRKVGPFNFASRLEKRVLGLSANKFRLTFNSTRYTRLNESFSRRQLDEPLRLLNPVVASIIEGARVNGQQMDGQSRAVALGSVNKLLERYNESLVHSVSARLALLGKPMPIVEKLRKIAQTFGVAEELPELSPDGRFGYATLSNATWQGPYEIYTGFQETAGSLGDLIAYKGKRRLNYYEGKCNRLQTSLGELRPMPLDAAQTLEIFSPNFCRILHLRPTGEARLREGQAVNFVLAPEDFLSARSNPDNGCFCTNTSQGDDHCSLDGVLELAPCSYNAPILLTTNTVELDPRIAATIENFEPQLFESELDELPGANRRAQFVILKRVGIPIKLDITVTLLMRVLRDARFKQTANVPEVSYVPLVTVRESVSIPPKLGQIIVNLESFLAITFHIKVVLYLTACIMLCWLTGHYYCRTSAGLPERRRADDSEQSGDGGGPNSSSLANGNSGAQQRERRPSNSHSELGGGGGGGGGPSDNNPPGELVMSPTGLINKQAGADQQQQQQRRRKPSGGGGPAVDPDGGVPLGAARSRRSLAIAAGASLRTVEERITRAAATNDPSSGERANSADSSRSLPPSRQASRLGSLEAADELPAACSTQPASLARIFSQVDTQMRAKSQAAAGAAAAVDVNSAESIDEGNVEGQGGSSQPQPRPPLGRHRRTGWFMNVYSRFVGMLNGIRSSIQDAGQLDLSGADERQDKQLALLAGKIDNWYSGSVAAPEREPGSAQRRAGDTGAAASLAGKARQTAAQLGAGARGKMAAAAGKMEAESVGLKNGRGPALEPKGDAGEGQRSAREPRPPSPRQVERNKSSSTGRVAGGASGPGGRADGARDETIERHKRPQGPSEVSGPTAGSEIRSSGGGSKPTNGNPQLAPADEEGELEAELEAELEVDVEVEVEGAESEADEDETREAERREQDEAHKAATLERIEASLRQPASEDAGVEGSKSADSANGGGGGNGIRNRNGGAPTAQAEPVGASEPPSRETSEPGGQSRRRVRMINSSTSIDSVLNSAASSLDSRITQVAAAAAAGRPNQSAAPSAEGAPPSAADPTNEAGQIDESSQAGRQSGGRAPAAAGRSSDAINRSGGGGGGGAGEQLASGPELPRERLPDSLALEPAGGAVAVAAAAAAAVGDNGERTKLGARNGISALNGRAASATDQVGRPVSSLSGPPDKTASGDEPTITSGPGAKLANSLYPAALTTGQVSGLVAAGGQPINVGIAPAKSPAPFSPRQRHFSPPDGAASSGQRRAAPNGAHADEASTPTFQRTGSSRASGNNILNEKIISHRRQPKGGGDDGGVVVVATAAAAVGFTSDQRGANETTGNHHHQRVQPAGA